MKRCLLTLIMILLLSIAFAAPVSPEEARSIAERLICQLSGFPMPVNQVSEVLPVQNPEHQEQTDWYLVTFQPVGFVLVSAEDRAIPILGYSLTETTASESDVPSNIRFLLNEYHSQFTIFRQSPELTTHPDWQAIRNRDFSRYQTERYVPPLIFTNWAQTWPYNSLCPNDSQGSGGHAVVGCVALSMAMIMKYWQHPVQGVGSHSYNHSTYGTQTANFGNTTYNYAQMPNQLWYTPNIALSTLLYHCGVAVNMNYGANASGAQVTAAASALRNFFNFESVLAVAYKNSYTTANWENLLRTELLAGRPMFYFGTDLTQGGHAFVCDGYQNENYFHFNWGWSGYYNGYFYVSNLNPGTYQFNSQQGAIIRIQRPQDIAAPTNLTATVQGSTTVYLEWTSPLNRILQGFSIYRNNDLIAMLESPNQNNFTDFGLLPGSYEYYVVANFTQGDSEPSNTAYAIIYPPSVINYVNGFENIASGANLYPFYTFDLDNSATLLFNDFDFPDEGSQMSFNVAAQNHFLPAQESLLPYLGSKLAYCVTALNPPNNDWLISPPWNTGNQAKARFWAKSITDDKNLCLIKVGISPTNALPAEMNIVSGVQPVQVPTEWTRFEYNFPNHTNQTIFLGINCVSTGAKMLLIDNIQLWSSFVDNEDDSELPSAGYRLNNYPNPFTGTTTINWHQKAGEKVKLSICDVKGRTLSTHLAHPQSAGPQSYNWNGIDQNGKLLPSGIYFCKITGSAGKSETRKLILLK